MIPYGVYIGKDIEVVCTDRFILIYRRYPDERRLESLLLNSELKCVGICRTTPTELHPGEIIWEHALLAERVLASSDEMRALLHTEPLTMIADGDETISVKLADGTDYSAKVHERFSMDDLKPHSPTTNEAGVGECLRKWNVGLRELVFGDRFCGITVNTWKHMYIFEMTQGSIYCRAARYATCDKGMVFDQNFRQGVEAYMIEDNRVAMNALEYDERLFNVDACVWNEKSVYWSTASVSDTLTELHGCQGAIYKMVKP